MQPGNSKNSVLTALRQLSLIPRGFHPAEEAGTNGGVKVVFKSDTGATAFAKNCNQKLTGTSVSVKKESEKKHVVELSAQQVATLMRLTSAPAAAEIKAQPQQPPAAQPQQPLQAASSSTTSSRSAKAGSQMHHIALQEPATDEEIKEKINALIGDGAPFDIKDDTNLIRGGKLIFFEAKSDAQEFIGLINGTKFTEIPAKITGRAATYRVSLSAGEVEQLMRMEPQEEPLPAPSTSSSSSSSSSSAISFVPLREAAPGATYLAQHAQRQQQIPLLQFLNLLTHSMGASRDVDNSNTLNFLLQNTLSAHDVGSQDGDESEDDDQSNSNNSLTDTSRSAASLPHTGGSTARPARGLSLLAEDSDLEDEDVQSTVGESEASIAALDLGEQTHIRIALQQRPPAHASSSSFSSNSSSARSVSSPSVVTLPTDKKIAQGFIDYNLVKNDGTFLGVNDGDADHKLVWFSNSDNASEFALSLNGLLRGQIFESHLDSGSKCYYVQIPNTRIQQLIARFTSQQQSSSSAAAAQPARTTQPSQQYRHPQTQLPRQAVQPATFSRSSTRPGKPSPFASFTPTPATVPLPRTTSTSATQLAARPSQSHDEFIKTQVIAMLGEDRSTEVSEVKDALDSKHKILGKKIKFTSSQAATDFHAALGQQGGLHASKSYVVLTNADLGALGWDERSVLTQTRTAAGHRVQVQTTKQGEPSPDSSPGSSPARQRPTASETGDEQAEPQALLRSHLLQQRAQQSRQYQQPSPRGFSSRQQSDPQDRDAEAAASSRRRNIDSIPQQQRDFDDPSSGPHSQNSRTFDDAQPADQHTHSGEMDEIKRTSQVSDQRLSGETLSSSSHTLLPPPRSVQQPIDQKNAKPDDSKVRGAKLADLVKPGNPPEAVTSYLVQQITLMVSTFKKELASHYTFDFKKDKLQKQIKGLQEILKSYKGEGCLMQTLDKAVILTLADTKYPDLMSGYMTSNEVSKLLEDIKKIYKENPKVLTADESRIGSANAANFAALRRK